MIPGDDKKKRISTNFFSSSSRDRERGTKGLFFFIMPMFPGSDGKECDDGGKVQKWEVLETGRKKRTIVLMVVGDAAKDGLCSLSLVLVYRRIILLSTKTARVGICRDVQNEAPFMISLKHIYK